MKEKCLNKDLALERKGTLQKQVRYFGVFNPKNKRLYFRKK